MGDGRQLKMEQKFLWYAASFSAIPNTNQYEPSSVYSFHPKNEVPISTHDPAAIRIEYLNGNNVDILITRTFFFHYYKR